MKKLFVEKIIDDIELIIEVHIGKFIVEMDLEYGGNVFRVR